MTAVLSGVEAQERGTVEVRPGAPEGAACLALKGCTHAE